jgi:hypothetical protein
VAEDEELVRMVIVDALEDADFDVMEAEGQKVRQLGDLRAVEVPF